MLTAVRGARPYPGPRKVVHLGTIVEDELDVPTWQRKRQAEGGTAAAAPAAGTPNGDKYDIPAFLRKQAN